MLSEISQMEKDKYHMISLIGNLNSEVNKQIKQTCRYREHFFIFYLFIFRERGKEEEKD